MNKKLTILKIIIYYILYIIQMSNCFKKFSKGTTNMFSKIDKGADNMFSDLYDISPILLVQNGRIVRGQWCANDYWHGFDGEGAKILGREWSNWINADPIKRMPGVSKFNPNEPWNKRTNYNNQPESVFSDFFLDHDFTVYELLVNDSLQSFKTLITDQWRYEWYEWTEEMVKDLCS